MCSDFLWDERDGSQLVYTFNIGIGIAIGIGIDACNAFSIPIPISIAIAIPTTLKGDRPCKLIFRFQKYKPVLLDI